MLAFSILTLISHFGLSVSFCQRLLPLVDCPLYNQVFPASIKCSLPLPFSLGSPSFFSQVLGCCSALLCLSETSEISQTGRNTAWKQSQGFRDFQYSCLENPMGRGAWQATVHGVAKSQTGLSDVTFTFHFHALEKEMATHSSVLAWRIPGTGEPGGCRLWGCTESDTPEVTQQQQQTQFAIFPNHVTWNEPPHLSEPSSAKWICDDYMRSAV